MNIIIKWILAPVLSGVYLQNDGHQWMHQACSFLKGNVSQIHEGFLKRQFSAYLDQVLQRLCFSQCQRMSLLWINAFYQKCIWTLVGRMLLYLEPVPKPSVRPTLNKWKGFSWFVFSPEKSFQRDTSPTLWKLQGNASGVTGFVLLELAGQTLLLPKRFLII